MEEHMLSANQTRRAYRPEEVGDLLGVSRSTVYRLLGEGVLGSIKVGGSRRVTQEQIEDFMASLVATSSDPPPRPGTTPESGGTTSAEPGHKPARATA